MSTTQTPLRLKKKHGSGLEPGATPADGRRLLDAQSVRGAVLAGVIAVIVFSLIWVALTQLTDRYLPWMTVVLGWMIGIAVRRAGRGVDWYFPAIAALLAAAGSLIANVVVAASITAESMDTGVLQVLRATTSMTWPVFFDEVLNAADAIYAVCAAALAAFFAPRRLTRQQYFALRTLREENNNG